MNISDRVLILVCAEIAEALGDLAFAVLMPNDNNNKLVKISGCYAGIQRALARLEVPDQISAEEIRLGKELGPILKKKIEGFQLKSGKEFLANEQALADLPAFVEKLLCITGYVKSTKTQEG